MKPLFAVALGLAAALLCASANAMMSGKCDGACQPVDYSCPGSYEYMGCPVSGDIMCCPEPTPDCSGQCQDNTLPCNGTYSAGKCPGPYNIQCCESSTPPPSGSCQAFADAQWNCATPACTTHVPTGSPQPQYQCAEFVSRTLASGGLLPIDPMAPQSEYGSFSYQGKTYDLLWVSSKQGGPLGLGDLLTEMGWSSGGSIQECSALMCEGSEGAYSHAVVGVGADTLDAHNNARYHVSGDYYQINEVLNPPAEFFENPALYRIRMHLLRDSISSGFSSEPETARRRRRYMPGSN